MATKRKKKKRTTAIRKVFFFMLIIVLVICGAWYLNGHFERASFVSYPEFGIMLPSGFEIHGIDVSKYQSTIDWKKASEMNVDDVRIGFVFIKATEGLGNVDPNFKQNWNGAGLAGITRGAYHFFISTKSGKAQAENFFEKVSLKAGDLPPVLDIEHSYGTPKTLLQQRVADWLAATEEKYRVKPVIYTNINFYLNFLAGRFDDYPLWISHYFATDKPRISRSWSFWQHNERGRVNGIKGLVDFNVFHGDRTDFQKLLIP